MLDYDRALPWTPTNSAEVIAFVTHIRGLATLDRRLHRRHRRRANVDSEHRLTPITVPAATGTPAPTYAAAGVPAGVNFNPTTRVISGTPTAIGSGTITVTATNSRVRRLDCYLRHLGNAATATTTTPAPPPRRSAPGLTYFATMFGAVIDLTPYVFEASWKHGSKQENYFGQLADPAEGELMLWNQGGEFTTFSPDPNIDPTPGPPVRINHGNARLFTGHSAFILNEVPTSQALDTASMPILGPFAFLDRFSSRLFSTLDGDKRTDEVWELVLDAAGFNGTKVSDSGRTILSAIRVNQASLLGSAVERIDFLQALRTVVQAEVGRGYDDRRGRAIFRNREGRTNSWANTATLRTYTLDHSNVRIEAAEVPNLIHSIINTIEAPFDAFEGQGLAAISFRDITLPKTYTIPSGGTTIVLHVDDTGFTNHVRDWSSLVRGADYTYTLTDESPVLEFDPLRPAIAIPNPSPIAQTFTLMQVRGDPQRVSGQERLGAESPASIAAYGPRPVIYPADLLNDPTEIQDHLEWCVRLHDGIDRKGNKSINELQALTVDVNLRRPENVGLIGIDIDSLCVVTEPRLGLVNQSFWVDSVAYHATADPMTFDMTLELSDARASMMWSLARMRFGYNTRIGF